MATLRAKFDGKVLVPVDPVDLQTGHLYELEVREPGSRSPSITPQALVQLLQALPKIPAEDVAEMERLIEEGVSKNIKDAR